MADVFEQKTIRVKARAPLSFQMLLELVARGNRLRAEGFTFREVQLVYERPVRALPNAGVRRIGEREEPPQ